MAEQESIVWMYCGEFEALENILAVPKFDQKKLFAKNKKKRKKEHMYKVW